MFQSLRLGKFFGIDLYIHGTFWLLPLFILVSSLSAGVTLEETGADLLFVFALFGCVALHEVGHALAARGYGVHTRDITLYPIGGVAALERMPEKPSQEIAIALAGPAVNFVIAGALLIGLFGSAFFTTWTPGAGGAGFLETFAARLLIANLILAVFNLLPCFPMDGGRVFRALLATRLNRVRATQVAVNVGSVVAGGFIIAGILLPSFGLIAVAVVVWLLGQAELAAVRAKAAGMPWGFAPPEESPEEWESATKTEEPPVAPGFTGLVWDANRGVWLQYANGSLVRVIGG